MQVKLVALTQPVVEVDGRVLSAEEFIVYCARVSSPQNQANVETAPRLLRYLIKHGHWSPFETVSATVEIETSRAISAQILRHRSFTFQEWSQRYSDTSALGFEEVYPRRQDTTNRQNSTDDLRALDYLWFDDAHRELTYQAERLYNEALKRGVAKESARFLLPLSTRTRLYMTGSLRSWIHYWAVRCAPETQLEHREVALATRGVVLANFPAVAEALEEAGNG